MLLGHRVFESLDLVAGASILAVLFLGAWHVPLLAVPEALVTVVKILVVLVAIVVVRNALPVLTPAVALRLCWIVLLPLAVLALAVVELVL